MSERVDALCMSAHFRYRRVGRYVQQIVHINEWSTYMYLSACRADTHLYTSKRLRMNTLSLGGLQCGRQSV